MANDIFNRQWIIQNAIEITQQYEPGILTIRALHYRLVAAGMTNTLTHYKRVVAAMTQARWDGIISFETFSDHDREMINSTRSDVTDLDEAIETGKSQVQAWMQSYSKNRWENQPIYPEVFIEKKALQGVFEGPCIRRSVALGACKGYPSLTFLNDTAKRLIHAEENGKSPVILYFGDYDPSGEDIPRAIEENLRKLGCDDIEIKRIALMEKQVIKWKLPPAPIKEGDSRSASWNGLGQVELDAVDPKVLQQLCADAIDDVFDEELHDELNTQEEEERTKYVSELKQFVTNL